MATLECVDHIDDDDMVDEHCNMSFNYESHVSYSKDDANMLSEAAHTSNTPIPTVLVLSCYRGKYPSPR